jgi:hypothetical protein
VTPFCPGIPGQNDPSPRRGVIGGNDFPFSIQYLITGVGDYLPDLHELFPVPGFHFDMQEASDDVGVFSARIVADLDDIGAAICDNG